MTLFWTDKLFVFAIYQHGSHGMEWRAITAVASLSIVLWASTILNFIRKVAVMIRCLMNNAACHSPPAWKWPDFRFIPRDRFCRACCHCTYTVGVLYLFVCYVDSAVCQPKWFTISKSSAAPLLKCLQIYMGHPPAPKKLLKKTWKQCRDGGWLTEVPVLLWWWAWILTQIDTGSPFPRGESPPRPETPPPLWIYPRTHQEAIL